MERSVAIRRVRRLSRWVAGLAGGATIAIGVLVAEQLPGASATATSSAPTTDGTTATTSSSSGTSSGSSTSGSSSSSTSTTTPTKTSQSPTVVSGGTGR